MKQNMEMKRFDIETLNQRQETEREVLVAEAGSAYEESIRAVVEAYVSHSATNPIIALAGPSSAGKTITSHRLQKELREYNLEPVVISLDDFFLPRAQLPIVDGKLQYDIVESLDLPLINRSLEQLTTMYAATLPRFDFHTSDRVLDAQRVILNERSVLILEGIHALNPRLYESASRAKQFRVYIDNHSEYYYNGIPRLGPRDIRFLRRAIRDLHHRGTGLLRTYSMWDGVCDAEDQFIRPFMDTAHMLINTAHGYEPMIYRDEFIQMAADLPSDHEYRPLADTLAEKVSVFASLPMSVVPEHSMLQEFIH